MCVCVLFPGFIFLDCLLCTCLTGWSWICFLWGPTFNSGFKLCHFSLGDVGDDLVSQHEIPIGVIPMSSSYHWSTDPLTQWIAPRECMALFPLLTWLCQGCPPAANSRKMPNPRWLMTENLWKNYRKTSLNLRDKTFNKHTVSHRSSRIVPKPNDPKNWPSLSSSMSPSQPVPNMSLDVAPPTCQHAPRMHMKPKLLMNIHESSRQIL